jgi:hypothetical protein
MNSLTLIYTYFYLVNKSVTWDYGSNTFQFIKLSSYGYVG